jgi:hypothetical protein
MMVSSERSALNMCAGHLFQFFFSLNPFILIKQLSATTAYNSTTPTGAIIPIPPTGVVL